MILVMFSGGLDSTAALYKLLKETSEPIHVHHIIIKNVEGRWGAENNACGQLLQRFKQYRNFKVTFSTFGYVQFRNFFCWDNDVVRFTAAQICQDNPQITKVALGKCKDDDGESFDMRAEQSKRIWDACFYSYGGNIPEIIRPVGHMDKKQIWNMLPESIRELTWSCRTPIATNNKFYRCNACKACKQLRHHGIQDS